jgi:D-3-phosphoglycerate dehydrogenase
MKDGVIIVNPARKTLIDDEAIILALESRKVATYAMDDVLGPDCQLRKFGADRMIATPHIAARTSDAWRKTDMMAFQNIVDFFEKGASKYIVNTEQKTYQSSGNQER